MKIRYYYLVSKMDDTACFKSAAICTSQKEAERVREDLGGTTAVTCLTLENLRDVMARELIGEAHRKLHDVLTACDKMLKGDK